MRLAKTSQSNISRLAVILITSNQSKISPSFVHFSDRFIKKTSIFRHLPKVLDSFVQLLQDPDCSLESLSLIDSKLKGETSIILNALGSNQSLINIDVSGKGETISFNTNCH